VGSSQDGVGAAAGAVGARQRTAGQARAPTAAPARTGRRRAEVPRDEASVLTWNLESFPLTPGATDQVAALIAELRPDVAAFQEVADVAAFNQLLAALPQYEGFLNDDPGAYTHLGLLAKRERVTVSEVETLFGDNWYAFPRPPLKAHITIDAPDPIDFVIVVLHLKAQIDADSQARRLTASQDLDAWLHAELQSG